ncbi:BID domain-containing T4SS effector [Bartonella sp. F02]|uniref:BID domain-containing T4SS effector n=1 Tax=Bartonella sp. F02 TaxID=2967262 RepID=UPI0022A91BA0|nr:BID domain-containing T4SS effector [Bartonella sp. F02]MCZ2328929.1 BID domain-containing T4SS effector [Bartonella sp. F02]
MMPSQSTTSATPANYCYNNGVLKNKYGIADFQEFTQRCQNDVKQAMEKLYQESLPDCFDSSYLMEIHQKIFGNTFEWAGKPRYMHHKFDDGTVAVMKEMNTTESGITCLNGDELQRSLAKIDHTLVTNNGFQNSSREDFINSVAEIMTSFNRVHLFVAGNYHTQEVFFTKLAQNAGYEFDFSLVTETHIKNVTAIAAKYGDLKPMIEMLKGISDPIKKHALKEFMDSMKNTVGDDIHNNMIVAAKEGQTYQGVYKGCGLEGFAIEMDGTFIVCSVDSLTSEQRKTFKPGDKITFTVPIAKDFENFFISAEKINPPTKEEIAEILRSDLAVQTAKDSVQRYARCVYGKPHVLDDNLEQILTNPNAGELLQRQVISTPHRVHKLAGFTCCGFGNKRYQNAKESVWGLGEALELYNRAVRNVRKEISQEHQEEQNRCKKQVKMPSKELLNVLNLSKEMQQKTLLSSSGLQKELNDFLKAVDTRLSLQEKQAINNRNSKDLAKSLGVPLHKAQKIVRTIEHAKNAHQYQKAQLIKLSRHQKTLSMAN